MGEETKEQKKKEEEKGNGQEMVHKKPPERVKNHTINQTGGNQPNN